MNSLVIRLLLKLKNIFAFVTTKNKNDIQPVNSQLLLGENCEIESSAIFIYNENSIIFLEGKNRIGRNSEIQPSKNGKITIGYGTSIQDRNILLGDIKFGRYCLTAPNVYISSGRHFYNFKSEYYIKDQDKMVHSDVNMDSETSRTVIIEDDVWIGINCVVMSGITIGRGSVIGANSVVTKSIPPFSVAAGNPAIVIKKRLELTETSKIRFDEEFHYANFYLGFHLDIESRKESSIVGGLFCDHTFTAFLNPSDKYIYIDLKPLFETPFYLNYGNQSLLIEEKEFHTYKFELMPGNCFHYFEVRIENKQINSERVLLIKQIETR